MTDLPRHLRRVASAFGTVVVVAWLLFAAVVIVLRHVVLPNVGHYRADIEQAASRASGETVRVGAIEATWRGLRPTLLLRDVDVVDAAGTRTLALPSVRATLSWQTLFVLQLRLAALEIDGASLTIRRDAEGQLFVAGYPLRRKAAPDDRAAEWLLAQDGIRVRGATIVWRDETDAAPSVHAGPRRDLVLTDVALALERSGLRHRLAIRATPPASLAAPLDIRATIRHPLFARRVADPAEWSGEIYADVGTGDVVAWKEWLPLPATLDAGQGRARVWATFAPASAPAGVFARRLAERIGKPIPADLDRIADVTADLALDDVAVRWGAMADAPEYAAIGSIDGRLVGSQTTTEQRLAAIRMALQPKSGAKVAPTDFEMRRTIGATLDDESGTASLGAVDIGVSLGLVPEPLVPPAIAARLAALKPRGLLEQVRVEWSGPIAAPRTFRGDVRFSRLSVAPQKPTPEAIAAAAREIVGANGLVRKPRPPFGQPGFDGLAGTLIATRSAAAGTSGAPTTHATLAVEGVDTTITAPGLFDEPTLRLAHLKADVAIDASGSDVAVKVERASLDNADLAATAEMTFKHGPASGGVGDNGGAGWIDLDAHVTRADVARVPRYLPNIIGERARVYLRRALVSGQVDDATLRLRGPLQRLSLREQPGALAVPNPVGVQSALVAVRDRGAPAANRPAAVAGPRTGTDVAQPPAADDTIFHAVVKVHGATYLYGPGRRPEDPPPVSGIPPSPTAFIPWPAFEDVDADIVFDRARMTVHARSARVYGYRLTDVTAELPALADPAHVLRVAGHGTGPMQDLVRFVNNSPISRWLRRFTDATKATGDAALAVAIDLPLTHPRDTEVAGSLQFFDNDVALNAIVPPLLKVDGRMDFSDRGVAIDGLTATALGGPLRVDARTKSDGYIELEANGTIDVAALQKSTHETDSEGIATPVSAAVDRAATFLSGSTGYRVALRVRNKRVADLAASSGAPPAAPSTSASAAAQPDLVVSSDLVGLAIALPAPLAKAADARWPLSIELARTVSTDATTPDTEVVHVSLADQVDVRIARRRNADGQLVVTRAGYRVGPGQVARDGPSDVTIDVPSIDADAWRDALRKVGAPPPTAPERPPPNAAYDNLLPAQATLKTASLKAYGRTFDHVAITASRSDAGWRADVAADQVEGTLSYTDVSGHAEARNGVAPVASGKLVARLARLSIPQSEATAPRATQVDPALDASRQKDFPAIDVVVDRFELRGRPLGRLEVVADNVDDGADHEWRLQTLGLTMPEARFAAHGVWGRGADGEHTRLDFAIQASDVGALMDRFGLNRTINKGTAKLSGNAAWSGGPSTIDFGTLSGAMKLEADKGQFLKAEPGVAKLLNILSLQGLARRLTLDFTDVFSPGFAFDTVRADAVVDHGIATTDDFTMRGVQAIVTMSGSADLEHETTKLHVRVEPQINAGAASLGVAVINPAVGLATFVAQYLFKDRISDALAFEYNVSGPWSKPDVVKIDRHGNATPVVPKRAAAAPPDVRAQ